VARAGTLSAMMIRDATPHDWPAIWPFLQGIVAAGDTFTWDTDTDEATARASWMHGLPGRTFVAVDDRDTVMGSAEMQPNHGGPGAHVANAGFMVDPAFGRRGVGRALCEHVVEQARADGYRAMQFNAVAESNTHAVKLWRSCGFETLVTVPEAFRHPTIGYVGLHIMYQSL
jgi:L-amino acid N-acyltransferase YncA